MKSFAELFASKREEVVHAWRRRILDSYPSAAKGAFCKKKDDSRNPIGSAIEEGTDAIVGLLLKGGDKAEMTAAVDGIVRMRAVQEFTPSEAVAFVFELKPVLDDVLAPAARAGGHDREIRDLGGRVDEVALAAFDVYLACREKIWELKAAMMRDRSYKLMERAGLLWEEEGAKDTSDAERGDAR